MCVRVSKREKTMITVECEERNSTLDTLFIRMGNSHDVHYSKEVNDNITDLHSSGKMTCASDLLFLGCMFDMSESRLELSVLGF